MKTRTMAALGAMLALVVGSVVLTNSAAYAATGGSAAAPHCAYNADSGELACAATPERARADAGSLASYLVVQLWKDAGYLGATLTYYKSSACTTTMTDREIQVPVVPSGWNDVLTSVKTDLSTASTKCSLRIYEHGRFTGASFTVDHYTPNLGGFGWNDRASSWYIS